MSLSDAMKALLKGQGYSDAQIAAIEASASSTTTKKTPITKAIYPTIFSPTKAKAFINQEFNRLLNRDATSAEIAKYTPLLQNAQKNKPSVVDYLTKGSTLTQATQQGLDEGQWLKDEILKDKNLKSEYDKVRISSPEVADIAYEKRIYDQALKAAGKDLGKIQEVKQMTAYGRRVAELEAQLNAYALEKGATTSADELVKIAEELISKGLDLRSEVGMSLVENKLKFGKGKITVGKKTTEGFTGTAGENVDKLTRVALANGLTLDKVFDSTSLEEVLNNINAGESIDTYARIIRDAAKVAWNVPDNVAKLMDQGVSLDSIYAPYKNTYADTLELDPNNITLNDLAKFGIVGQQTAGSTAPQNLYDFQRALRKDDRWQYTKQARDEVANATQKILQDFGFMG